MFWTLVKVVLTSYKQENYQQIDSCGGGGNRIRVTIQYFVVAAPIGSLTRLGHHTHSDIDKKTTRVSLATAEFI